MHNLNAAFLNGCGVVQRSFKRLALTKLQTERGYRIETAEDINALIYPL